MDISPSPMPPHPQFDFASALSQHSNQALPSTASTAVQPPLVLRPQPRRLPQECVSSTSRHAPLLKSNSSSTLNSSISRLGQMDISAWKRPSSSSTSSGSADMLTDEYESPAIKVQQHQRSISHNTISNTEGTTGQPFPPSKEFKSYATMPLAAHSLQPMPLHQQRNMPIPFVQRVSPSSPPSSLSLQHRFQQDFLQIAPTVAFTSSQLGRSLDSVQEQQEQPSASDFSKAFVGQTPSFLPHNSVSSTSSFGSSPPYSDSQYYMSPTQGRQFGQRCRAPKGVDGDGNRLFCGSADCQGIWPNRSCNNMDGSSWMTSRQLSDLQSSSSTAASSPRALVSPRLSMTPLVKEELCKTPKGVNEETGEEMFCGVIGCAGSWRRNRCTNNNRSSWITAHQLRLKINERRRSRNRSRKQNLLTKQLMMRTSKW